MYYHIIANIDTRFSSAEEALKFYTMGTGYKPYIPETCACGEDNVTPRIPVAQSVEDCITSIGVIGRFRRCCAENEDAKSYEVEGKEAYPLILVMFNVTDDEVYVPSVEEVPDVWFTQERWLLEETKPEYVELVWVYPESIRYDIVGKQLQDKVIFYCTQCHYTYEPLEGRHHPWLDGKGHVLESSETWDYSWDAL